MITNKYIIYCSIVKADKMLKCYTNYINSETNEYCLIKNE